MLNVPDQIASTSIMNLIIKFGKQTMMLYDALLSEKRILMAGQLDYSISSIIDFVLAASSLVSPPFYSVHNNVFPHVHLKEIGTLAKEPCFIAGVTNPTFLINKSMQSVNC